jgi:hypothetical protein
MPIHQDGQTQSQREGRLTLTVGNISIGCPALIDILGFVKAFCITAPLRCDTLDDEFLLGTPTFHGASGGNRLDSLALALKLKWTSGMMKCDARVAGFRAVFFQPVLLRLASLFTLRTAICHFNPGLLFDYPGRRSPLVLHRRWADGDLSQLECQYLKPFDEVENSRNSVLKLKQFVFDSYPRSDVEALLEEYAAKLDEYRHSLLQVLQKKRSIKEAFGHLKHVRALHGIDIELELTVGPSCLIEASRYCSPIALTARQATKLGTVDAFLVEQIRIWPFCHRARSEPTDQIRWSLNNGVEDQMPGFLFEGARIQSESNELGCSRSKVPLFPLPPVDPRAHSKESDNQGWSCALCSEANDVPRDRKDIIHEEIEVPNSVFIDRAWDFGGYSATIVPEDEVDQGWIVEDFLKWHRKTLSIIQDQQKRSVYVHTSL